MATEKVKVYEQGGKRAMPIWMWLLPLLLLLLFAAWLLTRHNQQPSRATSIVGDSTKPDVVPGTVVAPTTWTAATISDSIRKNGRVSFDDTQVHFATASATLAADSQAVLEQASQALKENPTWHMKVVGHTDAIGSDSSNDQLAQRRAESVKAFLIAHGVNAGSLSTAEKGAGQPAATNSTDSGRAENRRVELIRE